MSPVVEALRKELTPLPERLKALPVYRGYPVPWFVEWLANGEPEFRAMDGRKWTRAVKQRLCWVCGQQLGSYLAFVLGPMCGITHTTVEPACHRECAMWSILNCPFMSKPQMVRRENDLPEGWMDPAGHGLRRNPGVTLLWITRGFKVFHDDDNRPMLSVGNPLEVEFFREGRAATRAEIEESLAGGLPELRAMAVLGGPEDKARLERQVDEFMKLLP